MLTQWEKCPIHWNLSCICVYRWPNWLRTWKISYSAIWLSIVSQLFHNKVERQSYSATLIMRLPATFWTQILLDLHPTSGGYIQVYHQPNEVSTCRLYKLNPLMCPFQCMKFHTVMPDLTKKWLFSYTNLQYNWTKTYIYLVESTLPILLALHYLCPRPSIKLTVLVIRHEVWLSLCVLVTAGYVLTVVWNVK